VGEARRRKAEIKALNTQSATPGISAQRVAPAHAWNQLVGLFNAGRFTEVEILARSLIGQYPDSGLVWMLLGISLKLQGKDGLSALQKATELLPDDAGVHYNLGLVLKDLGKFNEAVLSLRRALAIKPDYLEAHSILGMVLKDLGQLDDAVASFRRVLEIQPNSAEAHNNLGNVLKEELGRIDEAAESYRRALAIAPNFAGAHYNLGNTLKDLGQLDAALASYQRALKINPDYAEAHYNLGLVLKDIGRLDDAVASFRRALAIKPNYVEVHNNLGIALKDLGQLDAAAASFRRLLAIKPDSAEGHNNLGNALKEEFGQIEEAMASFHRALAIKPDLAEAHYNLGNALKELGQIDKAVASYCQALAIKPDYVDAHSNLLLAMHYSERYSPAGIFAEHQAFAAQFEQPLKTRWEPHGNLLDPRRRLRVAYVSPDFRNHAVAFFIEPVLAHHDKNEFEVSCYYNFPRHDPVTERLRGTADRWLDCAHLSDDELAQRIRDDGIDILVDLAWHTAHNRLLTFARKPAPIQVTCFGFPATTGLTAMDYRITDGYADPPGMTEHLHTETLRRLPKLFWCYRPHENSPPVIDHPPVDDKGYITFGCFNNYAKITDAALKLWAQILDRLSTARLFLKIKGIDRPIFRTETEARMQRLGIPLERLILEPHSADYLEQYNQMDIALDTFPFNGGTTSMDTMWMGVPFITLAGNACVSRMGVSILTNAGLPELIAETPEAYVDLAVRLALDPLWLRDLRHQLRKKVGLSPLMDEVGFTRQLEAAYREMWLAYCARVKEVAGSADRSVAMQELPRVS
jgi:predicted O-linked N-acetylglucosamine transferase (SPINDLY family)